MPLPEPSDNVNSYLQHAGGDHVRSTLNDLIAISGHEESAELSPLSPLLLWIGCDRMVGRIEYRTRFRDETWARNSAAAAFAAMALAEFDLAGAWDRTTDFVRSSWDCSDPEQLPRPCGPDLAEQPHFLALAAAAQPGHGQSPVAAPPENADAVRIQHTWMLGVLLRLEASAPHLDATRLAQLLAIAENPRLRMI
ncbi:MAG TPA: hypothetical protein VGZ32_21495 [Actinocrinis sp.]|uniref:hypothetical protein n=1 Tax=Actinocrinis sp. TaxID=1920516 RepID=UPI002DDCE045|nr:hypothetical protein [Actinocrinis sp.]HEV3172935.1 hypothetical protein [Actinocrinis sp.]